MQITGVIPQLRTRNLAESIRFYTDVLGGTLEFQYQDFYAGVRLGRSSFHLKHSDEEDPSVEWVRHYGHLHLYLQTPDVRAVAAALEGKGVTIVRPVHETEWNTRELVIEDDQGHTLYFGQPL